MAIVESALGGVPILPRSVSSGRSPDAAYDCLRNGLSTVSAVRRGWPGSRGWGSGRRDTGIA